MNNASVGRLRLRLQTPGRHAQALQQRSSTWCHAALRDLLARVMTAQTPSQATGSLDRLTLRLGDIPLSRFEAVMGERVAACLAKELRAVSWDEGGAGAERGSVAPGRRPRPARHPAGDAAGSAEGACSGARSGDGAAGTTFGTGPAGGAFVPARGGRVGVTGATPGALPPPAPGPAARFHQLVHYLESGRGAPVRQWSTRTSRDAWLQETLLQARFVRATVAGRPPAVALAQCLLAPSARRRLVTTWSGAAVAAACVWLSPVRALPVPPSAESGAAVVPAALLALQHHAAVSAPSPPAGRVSTAGWAAVRSVAGTPAADGVVTWMTALLQAPLPMSLHRAVQAWRRDHPARWAALPAAARGAWHRASRAQRGKPSPAHPAAQQHASSPAHPAAPRREPQADTVTAPGRTSLPPAAQPAPRREPQDTRSPVTLTPPPGVDRDARAMASAGLVLLWPLLPTLFTAFGWVNEEGFVDDDARGQAVAALDWLAWGDTDLADWRTPCACLLCGVDPETPPGMTPPSAEDRASLDTWLADSLRAMPHLARGGVALLRTLFLQRPGTLMPAPGGRLVVDPQAADVLLHDLPWPLSPVVLPWLNTLITVEWNT